MQVSFTGRAEAVSGLCDVTLETGDTREERRARGAMVLALSGGRKLHIESTDETELSFEARVLRGRWDELEARAEAALFRGAEPGPQASCKLLIRGPEEGNKVTVRGVVLEEGYRGEPHGQRIRAAWLGAEEESPRKKRRVASPPIHTRLLAFLEAHWNSLLILAVFLACAAASASLWARLPRVASHSAATHHLRMTLAGLGLFGIVTLGHLWQVPRDGPSPVGVVPLFTGPREPVTEFHRVGAILLPLLLGMFLVIGAGAMLQTTAIIERSGVDAPAYAKGRRVGTQGGQMGGSAWMTLLSAALFPFGLLALRRRSTRLSQLAWAYLGAR